MSAASSTSASTSGVSKMLRITRLHLLVAGIGVLCLCYGLFNWFKANGGVGGRPTAVSSPRPDDVNKQVGDALEKQRRMVAQSIATIGEAYTPLRRRFGDIPQISKPLRDAKQHQAQGHSEQALASARESWLALKTFRTRIGRVPQTYQVVRGDTLWRIAASHSPAHSGPGWVAIWKANRSLVNNFNRIEVGWNLTIPPERSQYDMPFWKPK